VRKQEIIDWTISLISSLGSARPQADRAALFALYEQKDFSGMMRHVRKELNLDMQLRIGFVNSGGPTHAPAWVHLPEPMPMYGSQAFKATKITVYLRKAFLEEAPFQVIVCAMAHELSHVVLDSMGHILRRQEEAVDLTAMILGFRDFFLEDTTEQVVTILDTPPRSWFDKLIGHYPIPDVSIGYTEHHLGYLTQEERIFASSLMR